MSHHSTILHAYKGTYWYIPVCTMFVTVYTVIFQYVPGLSQYIQVCTWLVLELTSMVHYLVHSGSLNVFSIHTFECMAYDGMYSGMKVITPC